ncbi:MAG: hypothetical protein K9K79_11245 [Desulfohalobiaceae bacterium]|nr:hypothetical protein [Desulfohalobiaceae bacterium]
MIISQETKDTLRKIQRIDRARLRLYERRRSLAKQLPGTHATRPKKNLTSLLPPRVAGFFSSMLINLLAFCGWPWSGRLSLLIDKLDAQAEGDR